MSSRKLRPDELELWQRVARTTDRLKPEGKPMETMADFLTPDAPQKKTAIDGSKFKVGEKANGAKRGLPGIATAKAKPAVRTSTAARRARSRSKLMSDHLLV